MQGQYRTIGNHKGGPYAVHKHKRTYKGPCNNTQDIEDIEDPYQSRYFKVSEGGNMWLIEVLPQLQTNKKNKKTHTATCI